jgi:hypothetical protein
MGPLDAPRLAKPLETIKLTDAVLRLVELSSVLEAERLVCRRARSHRCGSIMCPPWSKPQRRGLEPTQHHLSLDADNKKPLIPQMAASELHQVVSVEGEQP